MPENMQGAFVRRQELVCTEAELEMYGDKILLQNEVLYIITNNGTRHMKIGDGQTAIKDLPRFDGLPAVTHDDNGKVLYVKDGAWVPVDDALIVTVDDSTPSHTNAEIYEAVTNGKVAYLLTSDGTCAPIGKCTPTLAKFEIVNNYTMDAGGVTHAGRQLYSYQIQNDVYKTNQAILPPKSYVDAISEALIVTVDDNGPSHTSQQIYAAMLEGKLVYRHMWGTTYIPCTRSSASEAYFVSSTPTTSAVVDGAQYPMASIGIWAIKGNKTETVTVPVANRGYVDALFGRAMKCVGSVTLAVSYDVSIHGETHDVYYYLGNHTSMNRLEGFQYSETDPIAALKGCDILKIELTEAYGVENATRYSIGSSGSMADLFFDNLYGMEVFILSAQLGDMLFKSYEDYGEPSYSNIIITGYKLPKA